MIFYFISSGAKQDQQNLEKNLEDVLQQIEQMQRQNETEKGEKLEELDKVNNNLQTYR